MKELRRLNKLVFKTNYYLFLAVSFNINIETSIKRNNFGIIFLLCLSKCTYQVKRTTVTKLKKAKS